MTTDTPETPYDVSEVVALMGLSRQTVIRLFADEPGVIVIDRKESLHKRRRRTIRIPRAVFERVLRRITN